MCKLEKVSKSKYLSKEITFVIKLGNIWIACSHLSNLEST